VYLIVSFGARALTTNACLFLWIHDEQIYHFEQSICMGVCIRGKDKTHYSYF